MNSQAPQTMSESSGGSSTEAHQRSPECPEQHDQKCRPNIRLRHGDLSGLSGPLALAHFRKPGWAASASNSVLHPEGFLSPSFSAQVSHRWCCCPQQRTVTNTRGYNPEQRQSSKSSQPLCLHFPRFKMHISTSPPLVLPLVVVTVWICSNKRTPRSFAVLRCFHW